MTKKTVRTIYTDHHYDKEDLRSFMLPIYLTRIASVRDIDTNKVYKLTANAKNVYGYLSGLGYNYGYNSIYPNVDKIAEHLGITIKTVSNALNLLEDIQLIKRVKFRQKGKFDSTHYWVYRPNLINRMEWRNINGDVLKGKMYNFDYKQFQGNKGKDKLLDGLRSLLLAAEKD